MDCLICNSVLVNDLTNDPKLSSTFCKLLEIPPDTFVGISNSICLKCSQKLIKIDQLFDQLEGITAQLIQFKKEIVDDLVKSHEAKSSGAGGNYEYDQRTKIVKEIITKVSQGQDDSPYPYINKLLVEQQGQNLCSESEKSPFFDNFDDVTSDDFDNVSVSSNTTTSKTKTKRLSSIQKSSKPSLESSKSPPPPPLDDPPKNPDEKVPAESPSAFQPRFKSLSDCFKRTNLKGNNYKRKTTTSATSESAVNAKANVDVDKLIRNLEQEQVTKRKCRESNDVEGVGYLCSECGKKFKKPSILLEHERTHTGEQPYVCHVCGLVFRRKATFRNHQIVHGIGNALQQCSVCERYVRKSKLKEHMESHEGVKKRPFLCSQCPMAFTLNRNLDEHVQSVHLNKKFECSQCNKSYYNMNSLKSHILEMHEKNFTVPCPECPMMFSSGSRLSSHRRRVHIKSKIEKCKYCDKSFYEHNLRNHVKRMHLSFKCTIPGCKSQSFVSKYRLDRHIELFHPKPNLGS